MQNSINHFAGSSARSVRLLGNHGYRFDGDRAILNAELAIENGAENTSSQHWALQLWACDRPYEGGPIRGLKVAEAELALAGDGDYAQREADVFARLPTADSEYNMVMVLASGELGHYDQVQDFSNYSYRQQFDGPRLDGAVGYRFEGDSVVLRADGVRNTRGDDNLSGSLSLELWATTQPYDGDQLIGTLIASASLGRLEGQAEQRDIDVLVTARQPPRGEWQLTLVLSEWTARAGNVTRDFRGFSAPHVELGANSDVRDADVSLQAKPESAATSEAKPASSTTASSATKAASASPIAATAAPAVASKTPETTAVTAAKPADASKVVPVVAKDAAKDAVKEPVASAPSVAPQAAQAADAKKPAAPATDASKPAATAQASDASKQTANTPVIDASKPAAAQATDTSKPSVDAQASEAAKAAAAAPKGEAAKPGAPAAKGSEASKPGSVQPQN